jgi:hypothetical protein
MKVTSASTIFEQPSYFTRHVFLQMLRPAFIGAQRYLP